MRGARVPRPRVRGGPRRPGRRLPHEAVFAEELSRCAIYFGGPRDLEAGLRTEQAAFEAVLPSKAALRGMRAYLEELEETGELPAYDPGAQQALLRGTYADLVGD